MCPEGLGKGHFSGTHVNQMGAVAYLMPGKADKITRSCFGSLGGSLCIVAGSNGSSVVP